MAELERLKVSANIWDSDRSPASYNDWARNVSALVSVLKHGPPLEAFLDKTLDRKRIKNATTPSFLMDKMYDYGDNLTTPLSQADLDAAIAEAGEAAAALARVREEDPEAAYAAAAEAEAARLDGLNDNSGGG